MPALRSGDAPAKTGVEATQHFTQPPPRYSEASLVKRLEELGIGRPSTYAATLQTLKDREYVRIDKDRFVPEESGRLVTAFLERFFETLRQLRLHRRARGGAGRRLRRAARLAEIARRLLARLQAEGRRGHGPEAVGDHRRRSTSSSRPGSIRPARTGPTRGSVPQCGNGRLSLRGGKFGAFVACSNYPECRYTQKFGQPGTEAGEGPPELGDGITLKTGRFGPYVERGDKRASIPKDVPVDELTHGDGREAAVAAAGNRRAPGDGQADHRLDRPLRAVPCPRRQICAAELRPRRCSRPA